MSSGSQVAAPPRLVLVTGGARSGKSHFAQRLAARLAVGCPDCAPPVVYIATAAAGDEEMHARLAAHRAQRPAAWATWEVPLDLPGAAAAALALAPVVLVDCLSLWVSNRLLAHPAGAAAAPPQAAAELEAELLADVGRLAQAAGRSSGTLILVTNEVGAGVVPPFPLGRVYRDLLGRVNQAAAAAAAAVYLLVCGLPVEIKRLAAAAEAGLPWLGGGG